MPVGPQCLPNMVISKNAHLYCFSAVKGSNFLPSLVKESHAQVEDINNQLGSEGSPMTLGPGHALDMYKNTNLYLNDGRFTIHIP